MVRSTDLEASPSRSLRVQRLLLGPADIPAKKGRDQMGMFEVFTFGQVHHQPADDPELNRTLLQVVVNDMPPAPSSLGCDYTTEGRG